MSSIRIFLHVSWFNHGSGSPTDSLIHHKSIQNMMNRSKNPLSLLLHFHHFFQLLNGLNHHLVLPGIAARLLPLRPRAPGRRRWRGERRGALRGHRCAGRRMQGREGRSGPINQLSINYSYGHLWDYTFHKWGFVSTSKW